MPAVLSFELSFPNFLSFGNIKRFKDNLKTIRFILVSGHLHLVLAVFHNAIKGFARLHGNARKLALELLLVD